MDYRGESVCYLWHPSYLLLVALKRGVPLFENASPCYSKLRCPGTRALTCGLLRNRKSVPPPHGAGRFPDTGYFRHHGIRYPGSLGPCLSGGSSLEILMLLNDSRSASPVLAWLRVNTLEAYGLVGLIDPSMLCQ